MNLTNLDFHLKIKPVMETKKIYDLENRLVKFACMCLDVCDRLPNTKAGQNLAQQLSRSGTAPAVGYGEAQAADSHADFFLKMRLVLKEIRETNISLRIINEKPSLANEESVIALKECKELMAIFLKSVGTSKKNQVLKEKQTSNDSATLQPG